MIPLRSIPTLAISVCALVFVAWMATLSIGSSHLFADHPPAAVIGEPAAQATVSP